MTRPSLQWQGLSRHINIFKMLGNKSAKSEVAIPIGSMGLVYSPTFGCFFMVNVGKYTIHGSYGILKQTCSNIVLALIKVWVNQMINCISLQVELTEEYYHENTLLELTSTKLLQLGDKNLRWWNPRNLTTITGSMWKASPHDESLSHPLKMNILYLN